MGYSPLPLDQLSKSPYLYGTDISSSSIIKHQYQKKYPGVFTKYSVATFDLETDMLHGHTDPLMGTVCMPGKMFIAVTEDFVKGYGDVNGVYFAKLNEHLGEYIKKYEIQTEMMVVKHTTDIIIQCLKRLHEWSPDLVMIWNLGFDIPKCLETFKKYGIDPAEHFCDPRVPKELRYCKYKKGSTKKITASGQVKPKNPSEQWHSLICPAGFTFIDQMSTYRFLRLGQQEEPSYALDFLLNKHLGVRKLNFKEAEHITKGEEWHRFMQAKYPIEYMVYNNFDCLGTLDLEFKLNDISISAPGMVKISDFSRLDSQTKRFADAYHFYLLEKKNSVIGTLMPSDKKDKFGRPEEEADYIGDFEDESDPEDVAEEELSEEEKLREAIEEKSDVLSLRDWIVTLKSHMSALGLRIVKEVKNLFTMIRCFVYDSDAVSAYPSCTAVGNVSRETTVTEIITIIGIDEDVFRKNNINLLQGHVNAVEYCNEMFNLPKLQDSLALFEDME
jgi:hypothetical protein